MRCKRTARCVLRCMRTVGFVRTAWSVLWCMRTARCVLRCMRTARCIKTARCVLCI